MTHWIFFFYSNEPVDANGSPGGGGVPLLGRRLAGAASGPKTATPHPWLPAWRSDDRPRFWKARLPTIQSWKWVHKYYELKTINLRHNTTRFLNRWRNGLRSKATNDSRIQAWWQTWNSSKFRKALCIRNRRTTTWVICLRRLWPKSPKMFY